ncbi:extracellular solute-binding protein [Microbacterium sp. NPDC019599]|uniref:extracellular solute-binding protein n=1 Tax=Microbacterium sp. NPDC019599 TaxID=3154690 RepID=UPI0033FBE1FB
MATLWGLSGNDATGLLEPSLRAWNASNPRDRIEGLYFQNDAYKTKIRTAVGADAAPTIIYNWAGGTLKEYVEAAKVEDITDQTVGAEGKYLEAVWAQGIVNGKVYAVPMNATAPILLFYNEDVLDAAGVEVPLTLEEIFEIIPRLHAQGVAPFSLAGASKWPLLMWEEYLVDRIAGPQAFQRVMAGEKDAWSDPGIVEANETILKLVEAGAFIDGFSSVTADSNADVALLYTGKAAMLLQGSWAHSVFTEHAADFAESGLGYSSFPEVPGGVGDPSNLVGNPSGYFSISSSASDDQKASALRYLNEGVFNRAYTDLVLESGQVPPVVDAETLIEAKGGDFVTRIYEMTKTAASFQMSWDQALPPDQATALLTNLDDLFNRRITAEQFSDNMNRTIR